MAIISLYPESGNSSLQEIPPNLTNPICIGTSSLLADQGDTSDAFSGTNASFPIPLDQSNSKSDVQGWCPWDLLLRAPTAPRDGIYRYPDDNLQRPIFNACFSACSKYNKPSDCCTGYYNDPDICKGSKYSRGAKMVCPDAYSFGTSSGWTYVLSSLTDVPQRLMIRPQPSSFPLVAASKSLSAQSAAHRIFLRFTSNS